ncbi:MAG: hypothetical protein ABI288_07020 [Ginsengibacter sp.]
MTSTIKLTCLLLGVFPLFCFAQENSPYSRYGVGNTVPLSNISNRAMGGISGGFSDPTAVNSLNPATYSDLIYTTLDVGFEYNGRKIKSNEPAANFLSNNATISYLQVGFPLLSGNKKANKSKTSWGLAIGLKPISKINYKIETKSRSSFDSTTTVYEGNGGINEFFIGTGLRLKNLSLGFNTGYLFGEKDYDTHLSFNNDTVDYHNAHYGTQTRFGGLLFNAGMQYEIALKKNGKKNGVFRIGAYGTLKQKYSASRDNIIETYSESTTGTIQRIDSVSSKENEKGKVQLPASLGVGFVFEKEHFLIGADYETTNWDDYRFYGEKDLVKNSWTAKVGLQYFPASIGTTGYFNFVKYRAGFSFGNDYIAVQNSLPVYTVSLGGAFPLKLKHSFYDLQYSVMNFTFEYGSRGNNNNNLTESIYKVSLGFSLSDVWFRRQKYQ